MTATPATFPEPPQVAAMVDHLDELAIVTHSPLAAHDAVWRRHALAVVVLRRLRARQLAAAPSAPRG